MTIEPDKTVHAEDQAWLQERMAELTFGRLLKAHRLCEEWTQPEAAEKLGISSQMLSAYENERKLPTPRKAYEIGQKLGIMPESAVLAVLNDELRRSAIPLQVDVKIAG
jgi:transcriptional regulator with XRE-family HTH domain